MNLYGLFLIWSYMFLNKCGYMGSVWSTFTHKWTHLQSLCYIGSRMGHFIVYCVSWVLDKAPHTKETLSDFC